MIARVLLGLAFMVVVLIAYLALAWMVVSSTDACWWPWQELSFPDGRNLCHIGM